MRVAVAQRREGDREEAGGVTGVGERRPRQGRRGEERRKGTTGRGAKGWSHVTRHVSMIRTGPLDRVCPGYLLQAPWIASHRFARAHLVLDSNSLIKVS